MPYNPYFNQHSAYQQAQPNQFSYMSGTQQPQAQQPVHGFVYVTGMEGARAYYLPPNSDMPLFDSKEDVLYVKTTDGAGFPTVKRVPLPHPVDDSQGVVSGDFVTHDELERRLSEMASMIGGANGTVAKASEPSHFASGAD